MNRLRFPGVAVTLVCLCLLATACYPINRPISTYWTPTPVGAAAAVAPATTTVAPTPAALATVAQPTPTIAPTLTLAPTATAIATAVPTFTATATATVTPTQTLAPTYTSMPTSTPSPTYTSVPTSGPLPTSTPASTSTPLAQQAPRAAAAAAAGPTATPQGPKKVVITEADMQKAISSGVLGQNGVDATNLQIHINGGKFNLTADQLNYGLIRVSNLAVVGSLIAQDGKLQLQVDSVQPGGFVTAMLPSVANQALAQFASAWYVEQVTMGEGQVELVVR